ncbi:MAG: alpha/beta fold hydrolase [Acidimicrobiia bacterium]|nr:alpha/beta fold hydrolase [Acidimicrobiia bacterium]
MRIDVGDVGLEVRVEGEGSPVVLLHGWPDRGRLWDHQVAALVEAGHRVVVPDLRGFGDSDRPDGVEAYGILHLAGDVLGVLDRLEVERAAVVGHDWGAGLAWALASFSPDRVERLAVLSVGHPLSFRAAGLAQRQLSWYMLLFQFEGVAERWLSDDDWANLRDFAGSHLGLDDAIADLSRPGALTASLNWYRANAAPAQLVQPPLPFPPVAAPTMGIWSSEDLALTEQQMTGSAEHVSGPWRYERIDGAGHWMQLDAPERVNGLLIDFLEAGPVG